MGSKKVLMSYWVTYQLVKTHEVPTKLKINYSNIVCCKPYWSRSRIRISFNVHTGLPREKAMTALWTTTAMKMDMSSPSSFWSPIAKPSKSEWKVKATIRRTARKAEWLKMSEP